MIKSKLTNYFLLIFGIDLRSLALFRVCLGLFILIDLIVRFRDLTAFYTDSGIIPRSFVIGDPNQFSLYFLSGSGFITTLLFIIAAIFAITLIIGYHTRIATIASWILIISLQNRNPYVEQNGDILLHLLLFWAMFLPLGAMYSVDAIKKVKPKHMIVVSFATFALLAQMAMVYIFASLAKQGIPQWHQQQSAIYYSLHLLNFQTPFTQFLLPFTQLQALMTNITWRFEMFSTILFILPSARIRTLATFIFLGFHFGLGTFLRIGAFEWVPMIGLTVFFPSWFWETLTKLLQPKHKNTLTIYYDNDCGFCQKTVTYLQMFLFLKNVQTLPAITKKQVETDMEDHNSWVVVYGNKEYFGWKGVIQVLLSSRVFWFLAYVFKAKPISKVGESVYKFIAIHRKSVCELPRPTTQTRISPIVVTIVISLFVIAAHLYSFLSNVEAIYPDKTVQLPSFATQIGDALELDQSWKMFDPPPEQTGWFVIPGTFDNGSTLDLFTNQPVTYNQPSDIADMYSTNRWQKFMENLQTNSALQQNLINYYCEYWNNNQNTTKLDSVEIDYMNIAIPPPFSKTSEQPQKQILATNNCN